MKNYKCSECKYGSYYNHFTNLWACDLIKDKICTIEYLQAHCPLKDNPTLDDEYEKLNDEYEKGVDKMSNEKDWTGNEKTVFVTNGCSNHSKYERAVNDYYS